MYTLAAEVGSARDYFFAVGFLRQRGAYGFRQMLGRSANGRTEWKDAKGRSLKEIQELEAGEA